MILAIFKGQVDILNRNSKFSNMTRPYTLTEKGKQSRAARRQASEKALVDAARRLFSEKGYDNVSVTEIGKAAGVSHTLINAYFNGKAGLLYAIVEELNRGQIAFFAEITGGPGTVLERLRLLAERCLEADLEDRQVMRVLQSYSWVWGPDEEARNQVDRRIFGDAISALIAEGRANGELPPGADTKVINPMIFGVYTWTLRNALYRDFDVAAALDWLWPQLMITLGVPGNEA